MNNVVLDVAIGLIFIYTLYSLLATTISEFVATIFAYRGRMLELGLEQMLDGQKHSFYWWDKLYVYFKVYLKERKYKKLNPGQSYNIESIPDRALEYSNSPGTTFLDKTVLHKKTVLFAASVTAHSLYKRSSANSLFSKKPAYLSSNTFSDILLDLISPGAQPVLLKDIAKEIERKSLDPGDPLNAELAKILNIYVKQANGDLQRFKLSVETWYDETMDRVSGWYKRQTFRILLTIGFILAVAFNVGTIDIVQKLSTDKALREAIVKSASEYVKAHQKAIDSSATNPTDTTKKTTPVKGAADVKKVAEKKKEEEPIEKDTAEKATPVKGAADVKDVVEKKKDEEPIEKDTAEKATPVKNTVDVKKGIEKIADLYHGSIEAQNTSLGLGWGDFGYSIDSLKWQKSVDLLRADLLLAKDEPTKLQFCKQLDELYENRPDPGDFWSKVRFMLSLRNLIGFIITAFAISLGAPFWFDLLSKFINLRASGAKPAEEKENTKEGRAKQKPLPNSYG